LSTQISQRVQNDRSAEILAANRGVNLTRCESPRARGALGDQTDPLAPAGRRFANFVLVLHRALPDLQRMKHKPDQALGHRDVFCFFLVFHRALPDLQRIAL
jgi:hypothetical protein